MPSLLWSARQLTMELRHLRYFVAVADELHFGRAAERLHVAQPAVSDQIRKLEAQLGTPLFRRTPRAVTLTEAGNVLLPDARQLLRQAQFATDAVRRVSDGAHERLRLGYAPYGPPAMVSRALRRLRSCAQLEAELHTGEARHLLEDVRRGLLDGAIMHLPIALQGFRVVPLTRSDALVAMPIDDAPARDHISLADLSARRLLLLARSADPGFYDTVVCGFRDQDLPADVHDRTESSLEQILLEVASGAGVAPLPGSASARMPPDGIALIPFPAPAPMAEVALVMGDETPRPSLARLLDELRAEVRRARMAVHPPSAALTAPAT